MVEIGRPARKRARLIVQERQHHRNVMRRKAPKDIFLRANLSDIEPVGIQILNLAQGALLDQCL
jgi:hypothetical protein